MKQLQKLVRKH